MRNYIVMEPIILRNLLLSGGLVAVFFGWYYSQLAEVFQYKSLEGMLMLAYGNVSIQEIKYIVPLLFWMAPLVFLLYFLGDYISSNMDRTAAYIFTRTDQRSVWLLAKVINLFLYVLVFFFFQIVLFCIIASILGFEISNWYQVLAIIVIEIALLVLSSYIIILMINLLSLFMGVIFGSALVLSLTLACFFFAEFLFEFHEGKVEIIKWLPFTQGILAWHTDVSSIVDRLPLSFFQVPDFSLTFSAIYLTGFCLILIYSGVSKIKKMDIL